MKRPPIARSSRPFHGLRSKMFSAPSDESLGYYQFPLRGRGAGHVVVQSYVPPVNHAQDARVTFAEKLCLTFRAAKHTFRARIKLAPQSSVPPFGR